MQLKRKPAFTLAVLCPGRSVTIQNVAVEEYYGEGEAIERLADTVTEHWSRCADAFSYAGIVDGCCESEMLYLNLLLAVFVPTISFLRIITNSATKRSTIFESISYQILCINRLEPRIIHWSNVLLCLAGGLIVS
jgi:hypothetical protein